MVCLLFSAAVAGPYPPGAGEVGSTAVYMDDTIFLGWATGYQWYFPGPECDIEWQTPDKALGPARGIVDGEHDIVCMGRGGEITLMFQSGIGDGEGFDFAVFENAVNDYFLELAYVQVSSDGEHFFTLYSDSLTAGPVGPYGIVDPTDITGLAGKYRHGYGTPFDLSSLRGASPQLDVDHIRYVRIVDIIGDGSCADSSGDPIYDPFPTIGSAGFDLDAIGVVNLRTADIDSSGAVDTSDLSIFVQAWLSGAGDENWDDRCNIAYPKDNIIDIRDFAVVAGQWFEGVDG